jgi:glutaryl-CoA dehydrogenase (non-decarboxylating)
MGKSEASRGLGAVAVLVESDREGITVEPMPDILGVRASHTAAITFRGCRVPRQNMLGGFGFGVNAVALSALEWGRYSVAWGCAGILRGCREASFEYASTREQFGQKLREHQLVSRLLTNMAVQSAAARALCLTAGEVLDSGKPGTEEVMMAKYFSSQAAVQAAIDAIQVHGANGCSHDYPVARYLRDAKVMEIIEGSNEMQQVMIARVCS